MKPVLQAVHASWSLGATFGPFIIAQFLVDLPETIIVKDVDKASFFQTADVTALMSNHSRSAGMFIIS